ncbi:MAG: P1 family peptidase [Lachnospiraceae bacterium]|nr:P1 family peptidase [Lachnospiraceae bacterium]
MSNRRIRDYGITIGSLPAGKYNSIADVDGVTVGHSTIDTDRHKTGVTVILPCKDNLFANKMAASAYVLNGFGKTAGTLQINELGTLESPIALTNTLNVGLVHDALVSHMIKRCQEDNYPLFSFNPVVGECNDCHLNDIKDRAVTAEHVFAAIESAASDFEQGDVGAGKGTICYGLKGGIGSASRQLEIGGKIFHIGVLVQSNFGKMEDLIINGREIGTAIKKLIAAEKQTAIEKQSGTEKQSATEKQTSTEKQSAAENSESPLKTRDEGSIMSIIATDLPLSSRQLHRILKRAAIGLGRTGSHVGHGSGDVMIGFSTANRFPASLPTASVPSTASAPSTAASFSTVSAQTDSGLFPCVTVLHEQLMDLPFRAVIEAEEEAVLNSLAAADTVTGCTGATCRSLDFWFKKLSDETKNS